MVDLREELLLGTLRLPNGVIYSPLAGCSDFPFRKMAALHGKPGLMFCEMVKMDALVRYDSNSFHILDYSDDMRPIGAQLCGSKVEFAASAARIVEDLGFDTIDLNCGCPVDKVTKDGSGSGMLKNPNLIGEIIAAIVAAVDIPVTVKIRAGWDEATIVGPEVTRIAEKAGAVAISVHGRTRKQGYRGPANWDYITACVNAADNIKVFGNGDIFNAAAAQKMVETTGCDAILVSRGTMGEPWIAQDILHLLDGKTTPERNVETYKAALLEHFTHTLAYRNDRRAALDMRRVGCWYIKKSAGARSFRSLISKATTIAEVRALIETYSYE